MKNSFEQRDWEVLPGEVLRDELEQRSLSQSELARRMDRPTKTINEIVNGKAAITPETSLQLELVLGISANFWNGLESKYRARMAKARFQEQSQEEVEWASRFPLKDLAKFGLIEVSSPKGSDAVEALLSYFQVASSKAWKERWMVQEYAFRRSTSGQFSVEALSAWLRWGEMMTAQVETAPHDPELLREQMKLIRPMTRRQPIGLVLERVKEMLASAGVALAVVPSLVGAKASGAVHWESGSRVLMLISDRYKTDDQFWFSIFHEAGHVLRGNEDSLDIEAEYSGSSESEDFANRFARDALINADAYLSFVNAADFSAHSVKEFSVQDQISAGIVVGRLQHDGHIEFSDLNYLKAKVEVR